MPGVWEAATHGRPLEPTQPWLSAWVAAALGQSSRVAEVPLTGTVQTKTPKLLPSWYAGKRLQKPTEYSHHTRIAFKKSYGCVITQLPKGGEGHRKGTRKSCLSSSNQPPFQETRGILPLDTIRQAFSLCLPFSTAIRVGSPLPTHIHTRARTHTTTPEISKTTQSRQ